MKNSIHTKFIIYFFLFAAAALLSGFLSSRVHSQSSSPILDRQDEFFLALPFSGQNVSGKQKIVWRMIDSDQKKIPFEINLLDASCNTNVGRISNDVNIEGHSGFYVYEWDSLGALFDVPAQEDGQYCVEVKVTFLYGTTPYTLSSKGKISLQNQKNHKPEISTDLPKLNLKEGEQFSYQVRAADEDKDTLTFVSSLSWLTVNSTSGLATGTADKTGVYGVILGVEDGKGGTSYQVFSINVNPKPTADGVVNAHSVLSFSTPVTTIMSGQNNKISWQADDSEGVERQVLEYSNNGVSWVLISQLDGSSKEANWDTSTLPNGEYYLRISVIDSSGGSVKNQLVSKKYIVANNPGLQVESSSSLYNLSPLRNSNVVGVLSKISADFLVGDKKVKVESVQVFLDGIEITKDCTVDADGFVCKVNNSPESGLHKVKVVYVNEGSAQMVEDWNFSVEGVDGSEATPDPSSQSGTGINTSGIIVITGVVCIVVFLLLVPWAIYLIWSKRKKDELENNEDSDVNKIAGGPAGEYTTPEIYSGSPAPPVSTAEPAPTPSVPAGAKDEYSVGSQELGDLSRDFDSTQIEGTEQPTWLTQDQDIDVNEAARPVTTAGEKAPIPEIEEESNITQPHGLEPVPDDNE